MQAEVAARTGRIDAVVETKSHIYVFEFSRGIPTEKKNRSPQAALQQIEDKLYAEHFALSKKAIFLIRIGFNLQKRGISNHNIVPYLNF